MATQHENVQKRKGEILTEPEAVKRLKSEMMTREKKKVAKKARLAPDLREKKLQMGKRPNAGNAEQIVKKRKGLKQPRAKPSLKDQKKLAKKASKVVSKDSRQGSSHMLMDSGKNLPCRKSERQLKFRVLDRGVKENTMCCMCGKKEPDQEGDDEELDEISDLIINWWDCQKCKRWLHQICLVKVGIRRVGQSVQCIYCQSKLLKTHQL